MAGQRIPGPTGSGTALAIDSGTMCRALIPAPGPIGTHAPAAPVVGGALDEPGIGIVMTPVQLAAVLERESVDFEIAASGRIWGAIGLVGAALELVGAGALLLVPEPTLATKLAGATLATHAIDTAVASARQFAGGQPVQTVTASTAQFAAEFVGVDTRAAALIGIGADFAPSLLAGAVGGLRVLAVRRGSIRLVAEEVAGGHTIARHVGKTAADLQARLASQPAISAASTFHTLADAEQVVTRALQVHQAAVKAWAKSSAVGSSLRLQIDAGRFIGLSLSRGSTATVPAARAVIVLRRVQRDGRMHFVLTAYPIP